MSYRPGGYFTTTTTVTFVTDIGTTVPMIGSPTLNPGTMVASAMSLGTCVTPVIPVIPVAPVESPGSDPQDSKTTPHRVETLRRITDIFTKIASAISTTGIALTTTQGICSLGSSLFIVYEAQEIYKNIVLIGETKNEFVEWVLQDAVNPATEIYMPHEDVAEIKI